MRKDLEMMIVASAALAAETAFVVSRRAPLKPAMRREWARHIRAIAEAMTVYSEMETGSEEIPLLPQYLVTYANDILQDTPEQG